MWLQRKVCNGMVFDFWPLYVIALPNVMLNIRNLTSWIVIITKTTPMSIPLCSHFCLNKFASSANVLSQFFINFKSCPWQVSLAAINNFKVYIKILSFLVAKEFALFSFPFFSSRFCSVFSSLGCPFIIIALLLQLAIYEIQSQNWVLGSELCEIWTSADVLL